MPQWIVATLKIELERKTNLLGLWSRYENGNEITVYYRKDNLDPNLLAVKFVYSHSITEVHTN